MGRKKELGKQRTEVLQVRLTMEERARFQAAAEKMGLDLSNWTRQAMAKVAERGPEPVGS